QSPSSPELGTRGAHLTVKAVAGTITNGAPIAVSVGPPGTKLVLTGTGLCDGSTVEFGNDLSRTPGAGDGSGHTLTAATPRLAASGLLRVLTPDGRTLSAPLRVGSFRNT